MKMFRWLAAGAVVILLTVLVFWQTSPQQAPSRPPSQQDTAATPASQAAPAVVAPAPAQVVATVAALPSIPSTDSLSVFEDWARKYAAASPADRANMLSKGEEFAGARRAEMAKLIRNDPEQAIARALPYSLRKQLPESILSLIEQPVSERGDFRPVYYKPLPGREKEVPRTAYEVTIGKTKYETHTYGGRVYQPAHESIYVHGISLLETSEKSGEGWDELAEKPNSKRGTNLLALHRDATRRVTDRAEVADLKQQKKITPDAVCGVSQKSVNQTARETVLQYGQDYYSFCDPGHAQRFNQRLNTTHARIWASGGSSGEVIPNIENRLVGTRGPRQGLYKLLYIRATFADDPIPPQSDDGAYATTAANNRYFNDGSYGTVWWEDTITPIVRLPQRKNFYGENPGLLLSHAAQGAAALGYFAADHFGPHYVLHNSLVQYSFGGLSSGILNGSPGALSHELGHNFGLPHANFWQPEGRQPGPTQPRPPQPPYPIDPDSLIGHNDINAPFDPAASGDEPAEEYGNQHDVMGSGPGHFSAMFKNYMNWLPDNLIKTASASTTNRIFAFDTPHVSDGRLYAMRIRKDYQKEYWISYRQQFTDNVWFSNGVEVDWNLGVDNPGFGQQIGNNVLIDTTPDTTFAKDDAALIVGRTLRDSSADIFITPIALGGGPDPSDKWIDVVLHKGPFRTNQPPTVSIMASTLSVTNGGTVNFTATAQDPDGDALAYHWDFGDYTFGTNGPAQSKVFNVAGQYVVRCEVSDMKGGVASAHVVVVVAIPTTFTISGRILDTFGNPVQGVRVHNSGVKPASPPPAPDGITTNSAITDIGTYRYGYTDSQGYYVIGNIPPGTYTNRAFHFGYRTEPLNFTDPIVINNGNANDINFTATPLTRVRIDDTVEALESGGDGRFTITRQGDVSEDLPVKFELTGSAVLDTDYTITPGIYDTNGGQIVIPAGLSSIDLNVVPIDNGIGDGHKTVVLTLLMQPSVTRITTVLTNVLITNGNVVVTNTMFISVTNTFTIPGWELRPSGPNSALTWFQTDPTYVIDSAECQMKIVDDDPPGVPSVGVLAVDIAAMETRGDNATLAFFRQGAPLDGDLLVEYELDGTALNGIDYQTLPGKVTIPAGHDYALVYLTAINDLFVESSEFVSITVVPGTGYTVSGAAESAVALIGDDDLPLVNIFASDATAVRGGGGARITISRAGSLEENLLVNYFVTGTAVSGVDFNILPGSVVIPAGQLSVDVPITAINSSTNPLPRSVTVRIADSTTYNIYELNSATITIVDGTLPTVTLSATADTVTEGGAAASFVVTRTGPTTNSLNVFFDVGGSAWETFDYGAVGTNIIIPAGSATANIVITPINDSAREVADVTGNETIIIQVRPGTNYLLGNTTGRTMRVLDNEPDTANPAVGFMLATSSVREDAGVANLYVKVSANPLTNRPIQVEYRVIGGSAVAGVNYINLFPEGTNASLGTTGLLDIAHYFPPDPPPMFFDFENGIYTVPVQILNDAVSAGNKTLTISLFNPTRFQTNYSYVTNMGNVFTNVLITRIPTNAFLGPSVSHTLTILDVGVTTVSIAASTNAVFEGGVPGRFIVTRQGATNNPLTVLFAVTGDAANGSDFVLSVTNSITIPAGTNAAAITVTPLDDPTEEVIEDIVVRLLPRPNPVAGGGGIYAIAGAVGAQMLVVSDDGTVQFTRSQYDIPEDAGVIGVPVFRSGPTNLAVTVDYYFVDGSATNLGDYFGAPGTLTFAPGEVLQYAIFPIVDDLLVETNETFSMVLTNPIGGVQLGGQRQTTLQIINNDREFEFAAATFRSPENGGSGDVLILRNGSTNEFDTVTFTAANAAAGAADFVATNIVVEFMPGETGHVVRVEFLDDDLFEGDEGIALSLDSPSAGASLGLVSSGTLLIVDDECKLDFEVAGYFVKEYSNFVSLIVRRIGGTVNPVTVDYSTTDGTATNGLDYVGGIGTISFLGDRTLSDTNGGGGTIFVPGDSVQVLNLPIIDDVEGEGNETFTVTLSNPVGPSPGSFPTSTLLGSNVTAEVTIIDNELPGNVDYEFVSGPNAPVRAVAIAPRGGLEEFAGRVVIGGEFTQVDGIAINRIARLLPNGLLDTAFNPGAGANGIVHAVAVQLDGKVVLAGDFSMVDGAGRGRVARLNADGNIDAGFVLASNAVNGTIRAVAVQTNGQIIIAGDFTQVNGTNRSRIARLNVDGSLDTNFNASLNAAGHALAIQADGRILVGGAFSTANTVGRSGVARLNSDGTLDGGFTIGSGFNSTVHALALQPDGKVVVGGAFTQVNGNARNYVARLDTAGAVDPSFQIGTGASATVLSVAVHSSGKIILAGEFTSYNGAPASRFARLKSTGAYDFTFLSGSGANATVRSAVVQSDSAIVIGGDFTVVNAIARNYVARIHGDEKSNFASIEFASAAFTVSEEAGPAVVTLIRSGNTNVTATVQYATIDGTATNVLDYQGVTNSITFVPGELTKTFNVTIIDDLLIEGNETVGLFLTNGTPNADLSGATTATLLIEDNEKAVQFTVLDYFTGEGTNGLISIERLGGLSGTISVTFATSNGTAVAGIDYVGVTNVVVFGPGESNKIVAVPTIDDVAGELDETVKLRLFDPVNCFLAVRSNATLTILDNDEVFGMFMRTNTNTIVIIDASTAAPYPSIINVTGLTGVLSKVSVTLQGMHHSFPGDVDVLLVGPGGEKVLLMSDAGAGFDVFGINLLFDDSAATILPTNAVLTTSTNRATDYGPSDVFAAPAPAGPYGNALSVFNNTSPNGIWALYVVDDRGADSGVFSNGWKLTFVTADANRTADVGLAGTDSPDPITAGALLTYNFTLTNRGPNAAAGVTFSNLLPNTVAFVDANSSAGSCTFSNGAVVCPIGNMAVNGSATVTVRVTPALAGSLTNVARVFATDADVVTSNNVASVVTTVNPGTTADLLVTVTDTPDPVLTGQNLNYRVTVTNRGPLTATGVFLTNTLPESVDLISVNPTLGTFTNTGSALVFNLGTLANGAGMAVNIVVQPRVAGTITNIAEAHGNQPDLTPANRVETLTAVNPAANLVIAMVDAADPVAVNQTVSYTIQVRNNGPSAATGVNIFDVLPASFDFVSSASSQGNSSISGGTVVFQLGTLAVGASASATVFAKTTVPGTFTNSASVLSAEQDPFPADNTARENTTVFPVNGGGPPGGNGGLSIARNVNGAQLAALVTGAGTGIRITSTLLLAHQLASGEASSGIYTIDSAPSTYGISVPGIVLSTGDVLDYQTGANVQGGNTTAFGPQATPEQQALLEPITGVGTNVFDHYDVTQLDIEFDMLPEYGQVEFKVVFGSEEYPEFVNDLFIDGFGIFLNGSNIAFTAGSPININHPDMRLQAGTELDGILAPGGVPVVQFSAFVRPGSTGNKLTFIIADTSDEILDTTVYISSLQGGLSANTDVGLTMSATPEPVLLGGTVTYQIVVTNLGPDVATNTVVTDVLPPGMTFVSATTSVGTYSVSNNVVTFLLGDLLRFTGGTLTINATPGALGRYTNQVSIVSDLADVQPGNNSSVTVSTVIEPGAFANTDAITILDAGTAIPYPSIIHVSGVDRPVQSVAVTVYDLSHTYPADIDILLVGPQGQAVMLMSDAGQGFDLNAITLRFEDSAADFLPVTGQILPGIYKPTNIGSPDEFNSPAPAPNATALSAFAGRDPNGDWLLYIMDDQGTDSGLMAGGWRINIFTSPGVLLRVERGASEVVLSWPTVDAGYLLERASSPVGPWSLVTANPPIENGRYTVHVPTSSGAEYFRLRKP